MLQIINTLCKNQDPTLEEFKNTCKNVSVENLYNFKEPKTGDNLLLYAARFGNLNLIKLLHHNYSHLNFNLTNYDGKNALHEACQNSHLDCVVFLVEKLKVDVNALRKGDWYLSY